MGYLKIPNLYKDQRILEFKKVYALEKIHGTSAHIIYKNNERLHFFSGGAKHELFCSLFNENELWTKIASIGRFPIVIYGEAYGGKMQGMKDVYGSELRFVAFDVKIDDCWLDVPAAEKLVNDIGLEFVDYKLVSTDLEVLKSERDKPSTQAVRNGCGNDKEREGVVLRPPFEITLNNHSRLIVKYKAENFRETKTSRDIDGKKLKILKEAEAIADEWVTEMRLSHILGKMVDVDISDTGNIIKKMIEDIKIEAKGEIEMTRDAQKAISKKTAKMFKNRLGNL